MHRRYEWCSHPDWLLTPRDDEPGGVCAEIQISDMTDLLVLAADVEGGAFRGRDDLTTGWGLERFETRGHCLEKCFQDWGKDEIGENPYRSLISLLPADMAFSLLASVACEDLFARSRPSFVMGQV